MKPGKVACLHDTTPLSESTKVLVVGTTADYIDWIRKSQPGRALFLTDPAVRSQAQETAPSNAEEVLCDLSDYDQAARALDVHISSRGQRLDGIAGYDCESLELAAVLAVQYGLPFPSVAAVANSRDKYLSKKRWTEAGIICPSARRVFSPDDAARFFQEHKNPCVLKPLTGSGSELIFRCNSVPDCIAGFHTVANGLKNSRNPRMYARQSGQPPTVLAEALIRGDEYSCDFIIENDSVRILRLTRKILAPGDTFGTARGYLFPARFPEEINEAALADTSCRAAAALGIHRAICMLDFILDQGKVVLLEMTPRPGGDCLPFLLRRCLNLDPLTLALDFSQQRLGPLDTTVHQDCLPACVGLRLHARRAGVIRRLDPHRLHQDKRVVESHLIRAVSHRVVMPPDDYDSWFLGHVLFVPDQSCDPAEQCQELAEKLEVDFE
jgi:D-alanine-D-alanine ligase-like ATP-grasp enzyme